MWDDEPCITLVSVSDRCELYVKHFAGDEDLCECAARNDEDTATYLMQLIKSQNPKAVVLNLLYKVEGNAQIECIHTVKLDYAIKGEDAISPMGSMEEEYKSLALLKACAPTDFAELPCPQ